MRGSCHCGALKYKAGAFVTPVTHCHCETCRKTQAAPFASTARVRREDFEWIGDVSGKRTYESTPGKFRHFCGTCGSTLVGIYQGEVHGVTLGCVNGDPEIEIGMHIFVGSKASWEKLPEGVVTFAEGPTGES